MCRGRERKERGRWPSKKKRDRMGEQRAHPAEVALYAGATTDEGGVSLSRERAGEKDREKKQNNSADLAGKRRLRRPIVPVPVRAW